MDPESSSLVLNKKKKKNVQNSTKKESKKTKNKSKLADTTTSETAQGEPSDPGLANLESRDNSQTTRVEPICEPVAITELEGTTSGVLPTSEEARYFEIVPEPEPEPQVERDVGTQNQDVVDLSRETSIPIPSMSEYVPSVEETSPQCAYLTPLVELLVGTTLQSVYIHEGILAQSPVLEFQCSHDFDAENTMLSNIDIEVFTLVVTYLYTGDYMNRASPTEPRKWDEYSDLETLHKHIQLYSFGRTYKIDGLSNLASQNIEDLERPKFDSLLEFAQEIYERLPEDETWFTGYVKAEFGKALVDDPKILQEEWLSETIKRGGRLAVDLFTTLSSSVPGSEKTGNICPFKREHLSKLNMKGQWKSCKACTRERNRLLSLGSMIMSLAIEEHAPTLDINDGGSGAGDSSSLVGNNGKNRAKKAKKEKKKLKKWWRDLCQQPHIQVIVSTLSEAGFDDNDLELCPDREDHLSFVDGRWAWKDCFHCLVSRDIIFRKIRDLDLPDLKLRDPSLNDDMTTTKSIPEPPHSSVYIYDNTDAKSSSERTRTAGNEDLIVFPSNRNGDNNGEGCDDTRSTLVSESYLESVRASHGRLDK